MPGFRLLVLLVKASIGFAISHSAGPASDFVAHLPGYGPPPTPHWSGFLNASASAPGTYLHYWFASSNSACVNKGGTCPVVLWLNGGPGASSILGMLQEQGPLIIDNQGSLMQTLMHGPTWPTSSLLSRQRASAIRTVLQCLQAVAARTTTSPPGAVRRPRRLLCDKVPIVSQGGLLHHRRATQGCTARRCSRLSSAIRIALQDQPGGDGGGRSVHRQRLSAAVDGYAVVRAQEFAGTRHRVRLPGQRVWGKPPIKPVGRGLDLGAGGQR